MIGAGPQGVIGIIGIEDLQVDGVFEQTVKSMFERAGQDLLVEADRYGGILLQIHRLVAGHPSSWLDSPLCGLVYFTKYHHLQHRHTYSTVSTSPISGGVACRLLNGRVICFSHEFNSRTKFINNERKANAKDKIEKYNARWLSLLELINPT